MVKVRLERKPEFKVTGKKTWISNVEDFSVFWSKCHQDGTIPALKELCCHRIGKQTKSFVFGVSRVENDPNNRDFYFYIAAENEENQASEYNDFETFTIPETLWAIFESKGEVQKALFEAEMYAFKDWLPSSGYLHAKAPELEVYPVHDDQVVEFWLPVTDKD